jgi:hypothetical protein
MKTFFITKVSCDFPHPYASINVMSAIFFSRKQDDGIQIQKTFRGKQSLSHTRQHIFFTKINIMM